MLPYLLTQYSLIFEQSATDRLEKLSFLNII